MKRFISILFIICLCVTAAFAQNEDHGDDYDDNYIDGYVYEQNGAGDQSLKVSLMATFPLNFGNKIYVGGSADLGYYRFLSKHFAIGGEVLVSYNISLGEKPMITVPITLGVMFQPYYKKFEFPLTLGVGVASVSCQGMSYFPALTVKATAGAYYRLTETWSVGLIGSGFWIPQWFSDSSKNDNGLFATAGITARYHF